MAQTTTALQSAKDAFLEVSANGTTWTDISGIANSISFGGGDRASGEAYTFNGDTAIVGMGKRAPIETTFSIVYDEAAPYTTIEGYYKAGTWCYFRYTPHGDNPGDTTFTSQSGPIINCPPPNGEASGGDPLTLEFTHRCAYWTKGTLTT